MALQSQSVSRHSTNNKSSSHMGVQNPPAAASVAHSAAIEAGRLAGLELAKHPLTSQQRSALISTGLFSGKQR